MNELINPMNDNSLDVIHIVMSYTYNESVYRLRINIYWIYLHVHRLNLNEQFIKSIQFLIIIYEWIVLGANKLRTFLFYPMQLVRNAQRDLH